MYVLSPWMDRRQAAEGWGKCGLAYVGYEMPIPTWPNPMERLLRKNVTLTRFTGKFLPHLTVTPTTFDGDSCVI